MLTLAYKMKILEVLIQMRVIPSGHHFLSAIPSVGNILKGFYDHDLDKMNKLELLVRYSRVPEALKQSTLKLFQKIKP